MKIFQLFLVFFMLVSCKQKYHFTNNISAKEAKYIYSKKNIIFLDVRTKNEFFNHGNIKGSILIPLKELSTRISELEIHKNNNIIVYCRSGVRSKVATNLLISHGFEASNMLGGYNAWDK